MDATLQKQNGVHYTPAALARFLAQQTAALIPADQRRSRSSREFRILDPACGNGQLLVSLAERLSPALRRRTTLVGFDTCPIACSDAKERLQDLRFDFEIHVRDFLAKDVSQSSDKDCFDVVIANPPYVRTQVLGADRAQELARQFGLTGRVDLYQAFTMAIARVLRIGGAIGLLTSNRFLNVRSGRQMRRLLETEFDLRSVFDLGDTKFFSAAVLPVVVTGQRKLSFSNSDDAYSDGTTSIASNAKAPHLKGSNAKGANAKGANAKGANAKGANVNFESPVCFTRIYSTPAPNGLVSNSLSESRPILDVISDQTLSGCFDFEVGRFEIQRGHLELNLDSSGQQPWRLSTPSSRIWFRAVSQNQHATIGDLAEIRVGIKTTADNVFIRELWSEITPTINPELLRPLLTHHDAQRWILANGQTKKRVLYPYQMQSSTRQTIGLDDFPAALQYLESHRPQLEGRNYVIQSGREWFEIWVPQRPAIWQNPKIVWPDISVQPRFFFDPTGAIVNGDCYWMTLKPDMDPDWLYLILAIANSEFATQFYDKMFHNKLYAGRRRFMTQYVKAFPVPQLRSAAGSRILKLTKSILKKKKPSLKEEQQINTEVEQAFGL